MMINKVACDLTIREGEYSVQQDRNDQERARAEWKLLARSGPFDADPTRCQIWSGNTRDVERITGRDLSELISSIAAVGQQVPAIARTSPTDASRLEIIAGACRLTAIQRINEQRSPEDRLRIKVDLRDLDDEAAFKIVEAENRGRSDFAPIERARLFERAIDGIYRTEAALAEAYGLNKSTVNRLMAILKLPGELMDLIADPHQISARQASEFMSDWTSPLRDTLEEALADLGAKPPADAATVFRALKAAVAPADELLESGVVHGDACFGTARHSKGGGFRIDLQAAASEIPLRDLVIAVGNALKALGIESR